jgi:arylsulfatase A-like enzyme
VRRDRYKLYYDSLARAKYRLFDLAADPRELRDVSSAHPELAAELRAVLEARHLVVPGEAPAELPPDEQAKLRALGYL